MKRNEFEVLKVRYFRVKASLERKYYFGVVTRILREMIEEGKLPPEFKKVLDWDQEQIRKARLKRQYQAHKDKKKKEALNFFGM